jgi:hypothetical protein
MELVGDGLTVTGVGRVAAGTIKITLDANGNVSSSPSQAVWASDTISPSNSFYRVTAYTTAGQPVWGPNNQRILFGDGTFNVGTWIPNQ